jgi:hypothetical protein
LRYVKTEQIPSATSSEFFACSAVKYVAPNLKDAKKALEVAEGFCES